MALKPALEYSPTYRSIIGLVEPEQLTYEDVIAVSSQEDAEILTVCYPSTGGASGLFGQ